MSLLKPQFIGERIITVLKSGPMRGPQLLEELDRTNQHYTKQALYAALRDLMHEDVVVKHRSNYALNTTWILRLQTFAQEAGLQYGAVHTGSEILSLNVGESVSYTFTHIQALDTFWGHAQNLLMQKTPNVPIFAYDPHYWFLIAHTDTERALLNHIVASGRQFLMAVGGATPLDKSLARHFDGTLTQYAYVTLPEAKGRYLSSIGDYVITVALDEVTSAKIDTVFAHHASHTDEAVDTLRSLLRSKAKSKIKIAHNPRLAKQFRSRLKKYFFIKLLRN